MAMTTRKKSNHLKKLGFQKAPFQMTRVGITYMRGRTSVTIAKGDKGGGNFIAMSPGQGSFNSGLLYVGNMAAGTKQSIRVYRDHGVDLPDPDDADFGTPGWNDRLFIGITEALP